MADQKISQLTSLTTILPADVLPIVDNGQTYKATSNAIVVQNIITGVLVTGQSSLRKIVGGAATCSATGTHAGVLAGSSNAVNSLTSVIGGGALNTIYDNSESAFIGAGAGNLIGNVNATSYGFVGNGVANQINGTYAAILNGASNMSTGLYSVILNGNSNSCLGEVCSILNSNFSRVNGYASAILGGTSATITGSYNTIGGGNGNFIIPADGNSSASYSFIGGGNTSTSKGDKNFIGGGSLHSIQNTHINSILGGTNNFITGGGTSNILGGQNNSIISSSYSNIFGNDSICSGNYQTAIGNNIQMASLHTGATVLGDENRVPKYSFSPNSLTLHFRSGVIFSGTNPILAPSRIPASSLVNGFTKGELIPSGHLLLLATGVDSNGRAMFGKLTLSNY